MLNTWGDDVRPELQKIQQLAYSTFGLDLRSGKEELIMARIGKVMRKNKLATFKEYVEYVTADRSGAAVSEMIDALTTNFTSFFRENVHFEMLRHKVLPGLKQNSVRIWSAACSSGEEPYSIAFTLFDSGFAAGQTEIIATDISQKVLAEAAAGMYNNEDLKSMPVEQRRRYFLAGVGERAGWFKVRPEIRKMVQFAEQNLIEQLEIRGPFDVIFCRNVMIYFNKTTQQAVVSGLEKKLAPGGYLMIGHSETLNNVQHSLKYICPAVYRAVA
jgi:chemotaxis protein methyltransferase CheR